MSLVAKRKADAAQFKIRKVEILDGWVYIDGVRTRPAQPDALDQRTRTSAQRGANRRGRRR